MVFFFWKLISLSNYFKFYSHQKIFGSGHQKAPTNRQIPIFPANRARKFPNGMASKAESTLSRRCKNFVAVQCSAHEIMWCCLTLWGIQYYPTFSLLKRHCSCGKISAPGFNMHSISSQHHVIDVLKDMSIYKSKEER